MHHENVTRDLHEPWLPTVSNNTINKHIFRARHQHERTSNAKATRVFVGAAGEFPPVTARPVADTTEPPCPPQNPTLHSDVLTHTSHPLRAHVVARQNSRSPIQDPPRHSYRTPRFFREPYHFHLNCTTFVKNDFTTRTSRWLVGIRGVHLWC